MTEKHFKTIKALKFPESSNIKKTLNKDSSHFKSTMNVLNISQVLHKQNGIIYKDFFINLFIPSCLLTVSEFAMSFFPKIKMEGQWGPNSAVNRNVSSFQAGPIVFFPLKCFYNIFKKILILPFC